MIKMSKEGNFHRNDEACDWTACFIFLLTTTDINMADKLRTLLE